MKKILFCIVSIALLTGCENMDFITADSLSAPVGPGGGEFRDQRTVYATMSLYFLFEDPSNAFGDGGADFIPVRVALPDDISTLHVVTDDSIWGWGGDSERSDARGEHLEATRQQYHSEISTPEELPVGSLVGMWSDGTRNNDHGLLEPFYIGHDAELQIPEHATELILGMHDGYEWSNNWGSRVVTLTGR